MENIPLSIETVSAPAPSVVSAYSSRSISRDAALDIVKGVFVVVMVLYHTINYFPQSPLGLKYLFFVTGTFVFLAGFVASNIYLSKYNSRQQWPLISRRLAIRGGKLVLLALVLNVLIAATGANWKQKGDLGEIVANLFLGTDHRSVSFYLLVLIGYSLLLTGLFLALGKGRSLLLVPAAILCLGYGIFSGWWDWPGSYYIRFLALGQVGAALGLIHRAALVKLTDRLDLVLILYFAQVLAMIVLPPTYPFYVIHVICTVLVTYSLAGKCDPGTWVCRKLALLGQYSLLGYLFQIAFLQGLRRLVHFTEMGVVAGFLLACVATLVCVELAQFLNARSKLIRAAYNAVL